MSVSATRTSLLREENTSRAWPQISTSALITSVIMTVCLIALAHNTTYVETSGEFSVERGAGMENQAKLEKDVNNAPVHRKLAFLTLLVVGAYCVLTAPRDVSLKIAPVFLLLCLCVTLVVSSAMWSTERSETVREIIRILAYFGVTGAMARRFLPREMIFILATMAVGSVLFACGFELAYGKFRPWLSGYRLHGSIHTNVLASHAMVVALCTFAFIGQTNRPQLLRVVLLSMLMVILLCKSRSALFTTLVGMSWIYLVGRPWRTSLLVVSLLVTMACGAMLVFVLASPELQARAQNVLLLGRSEGATTLTGRVPLWQTLWKESREHRWLGYGYGAFWTTDQIDELNDEFQWYPGHAHSAYVQTLLDLGFVGTLLVIATAIVCVISAAQLARQGTDPSFKFVFGFLLAGFFDGLTGVNFVYPRGLGLFVGMAVFILVVVHPSSEESSDNTTIRSNNDQEQLSD